MPKLPDTANSVTNRKNWGARWQNSICIVLSATVMALTLRYWFEFFFETYLIRFPELTLNWTKGYCLLGGIIMTPISLRALQGNRELPPQSCRVLVGINAICFGSLVGPFLWEGLQVFNRM